MNKKILTSLVLIICVFALTIGTTLAWLTAQSDKIENTFTVGDINITLTETTGSEYKLVPSVETNKDPKVTVVAGSEACYLYIKVEKSANLDDFIEYSFDGWTELIEDSGIYYREVTAQDAAASVEYRVLTDNKVTAKSTITKAMVDALKEPDAIQPSMSFTAYAVQSVGFDSALGAWNATFGSSSSGQ